MFSTNELKSGLLLKNQCFHFLSDKKINTPGNICLSNFILSNQYQLKKQLDWAASFLPCHECIALGISEKHKKERKNN